MIALVIVVRDKGLDLVLQISRQILVFQKNAVLQGLMPALDLTLCHGVVRRAAGMFHISIFKPFCQIVNKKGDPEAAFLFTLEICANRSGCYAGQRHPSPREGYPSTAIVYAA